jgi:Leucine-rich repeat (LRR) protein/uncharacterized protein YdeI (BOF family)
MKKLIFLIIALGFTFLGIRDVNAQDTSWDFEGSFPSDSFEYKDGIGGIHGLVADNNGKIWIHHYFAVDTIDVNGVETEIAPLFIFNEDGSQTSLSPIQSVQLEGETHYFEAAGARGLTLTNNGDILISNDDQLILVDANTGEAINHYEAPNNSPLTKASVADDGTIAVGYVFPDLPVHILDENLNQLYTTSTIPRFKRTVEITDDASKIYVMVVGQAGSVNEQRTVIYENDGTGNDYEYVGDLGILTGVSVESSDMHNGNLWVSGGSSYETPANNNFEPNTWYEIDLNTNEIINEISWQSIADEDNLRPRGITFSGNKAYIGQFNSTEDPIVQVFSNNSIRTIEDARNLSIGATVTVKGVVTTPDYRPNGTTFFIQDETAGINIFNAAARTVEVAEGDSVEITGKIKVFNGLVEIVPDDVETDITIINSGNELPEPQVITYQEFIDAGDPATDTDQLQGSLVTVENITTDTTSWPADDTSVNITANDVDDNEYAIRVWGGTEAASYKPLSGYFNLTGVLGTYNNSQLSPFYASDFEYVEAPEPSEGIPEPPYAIGDTINYNGSFEHTELGDTEADAWAFNMTNGSSVEIMDDASDGDNRALQFNVSWNGIDDEWWNNEVVNEPINVVEGERYRFSVDLKADDSTRIAKPYIGVSQSGNFERRPDINTPEVALASEYTKWEMEWTATAADELHTMRFGIEFNTEANDGGIIYIDNARVERVEIASTSEADSLALVDLYNNTNGDEWNNNENWLDGPVKSWYGIHVEDGKVTSIDLNNNNLNGELPDSFSNLTKVSEIFFYNNPDLTGDIFGLIVGFDNLVRLRGHDCDFYGEIPPEIGNHINFEDIAMWGNRLSGNIPSEIGNLTNLWQLTMWDNEFEGSIPSTIGNLDNLVEFDFGNNNLSGQIPETFFELTNLEHILIYGNSLQADLSSFVNFTKLRNLSLSNNELSGAIPASIENLTELEQLNIDNNQISGSLPAEIGNLQNLRIFVAWGNQFEGGLPEELGNLSSVEELNIGNEGLGGEIPTSLGQLENLHTLRLNSADLTGEIPVELSNLANLEYLYLYDNNLSGEIPSELSNLENLRLMYLYLNENLSGNLPAGFGQLQQLERLSINNTSVSGEIPSEWGMLEKLNFLRLENNDLTGRLPESFIDLDSLNTFYLDGNNVSLATNNKMKGWIEGIDNFRSSGIVELSLPVLASPGEETAQPVPSLLSWNGDQNADFYTIELYTDESLEDTVNILEFYPDSWVSIDELDHNTTYYWRVASEVTYGQSDWSEVGTFTTMLDSEVGPELLTPELEQDSVTLPVSFSWSEVEGAQTYYLEITQVPSFDTTNTVKELTGTEFVFEEALDETDYFWRVRAEADGAPGGWSAVGTFTTELRPPETPTWEPEDGAENVPVENVLAWNSSERADTYNLQLADNEDFETLIIDQSGLEETELEVSLEGQTTYYWRIQAVNSSGSSEWSSAASFTTEMTTGIGDEEALPDEFAIHQNYPNPFNPTTVISYQIPVNSDVELKVFDMLGREITTLVRERKTAGSYEVNFDASSLSSGMYIYQIQAGNYLQTKKMMLIK